MIPNGGFEKKLIQYKISIILKMDIRKLLSAKKPKIVDEEDVTGEDNSQQCNTPTSLGLSPSSLTTSEQCSSSSTSSRQSSTPESISCLSPLDVSKLNKDQPIQPRLPFYRKTDYGKQRRSFSASWYTTYNWLEYIKEHDVALCYACRVYAPNSSKEHTFTRSGFNN